MATNKNFAYKTNVKFSRDKAAEFGVPVGSTLTEADLKEANNSKIFKDWLTNMLNSHEFDVQRIELQSLDYFGSHVGFLKMKVDAKRNGIPVPGIVFLRGGSVAILTILINKGKEYTVLTTQARVPIGRIFTEIPAGMLDENGNFKGVAANEMREETGIDICDNKLIDLTQLAFDKFPGVYPSPGGCDEFIRLYVYREEVSDEKLAEFNGKCTGNLDENEVITLKVIPLDQLWKETPDVKALSCLYLYNQFKREGKILPINSKTASASKPTLEINTKIDSPSTLPAIGNKDLQVSILDCEILKGMDTTLFIIESVLKGSNRKVVVRRVSDFRVLDIELKNAFPNQKLQDFSLKTDSPKPGKNIVQKKALQDYLLTLIQAAPNVLNAQIFLDFLGFKAND